MRAARATQALRGLSASRMLLMRPQSSAAERTDASKSAVFREQTFRAFQEVIKPFMLNFEDTKSSFRKKKSSDLLQSLVILRFCTLEPLVSFAPKIIQASIYARLDSLVFWVIKKTFFAHFCAGESLDEVEPVLTKLQDAGVGSILDYSAEGAVGSDADLDQCAQRIMETIVLAENYSSIKFSCLKVSALGSARLLERLSEQVEALGGFPHIEEAMAALDEEDRKSLAKVVERLDSLCAKAHSLDLPVLVDAEQTWLQPAIDGLVLKMSRQYNTAAPIVYNTFQMYLKDAPARLDTYIEMGDGEGHQLGLKLVRGAYMESEAERCKKNGKPYPVHDCIEDTHEAYDSAVTLAMARLDRTGLLIASHNQTTVEKAVELLVEHGLPTDHPHIHFGQLYGMADHLSFALGSNNFNICKYVPFGPIREVIPYLIRRLEENASILGGTPYERQLLWQELKRRRVRLSFQHS